jgi:hypothetical protein
MSHKNNTKYFMLLKVFHQQRSEQLIFAKSAAAAKEGKYNNKLCVNFMYENIIVN